MPILGIIASSKAVAPAGSYESISTVTVGSGGTATITFTSIPGTYTHLQVRGIAKSNSVGTLYLNYGFNGVAGTSYSSHYLFGNGSTAGANAGNGASASSMYFNEFPPSTVANTFGVFVLDILDYTNTNKYKTTRILSGNDQNGSGVVSLSSGLFMSTNAITQIDLNPQSAAGFAQYTQFALYGIKGA